MMPCCCYGCLDSSELRKPSNETLLSVAFVSFMTFAAVQTVVALIAQSEAMLGDTAAMVVDSMTYGFNLYAEKKKKEEVEAVPSLTTDTAEQDETDISADIHTGINSEERILLSLSRRRRYLHLELVPPIISVSVLLVVIGFILSNSIHTLILDANRSEKEQSRPNLIIMMTFSVLNLFLDLMNVFCFARAKHIMGYKTQDDTISYEYNTIDDQNGLVQDFDETQFEIHDTISGRKKCEGTEELDKERVNLNMCSAYTHVFADTFRSIAVISASIIAEVLDWVTPEIADSCAAIVVSVIILLSLVPLFRGIFHTWRELRSLTRDDDDDVVVEEEALFANDKDQDSGVEMN